MIFISILILRNTTDFHYQYNPVFWFGELLKILWGKSLQAYKDNADQM